MATFNSTSASGNIRTSSSGYKQGALQYAPFAYAETRSGYFAGTKRLYPGVAVSKGLASTGRGPALTKTPDKDTAIAGIVLDDFLLSAALPPGSPQDQVPYVEDKNSGLPYAPVKSGLIVYVRCDSSLAATLISTPTTAFGWDFVQSMLTAVTTDSPALSWTLEGLYANSRVATYNNSTDVATYASGYVAAVRLV